MCWCPLGPPLSGSPGDTQPSVRCRHWESGCKDMGATEYPRGRACCQCCSEVGRGILASHHPPTPVGSRPREFSSRGHVWFLCLKGWAKSHTCSCSWSPTHLPGQKFHTPCASRTGTGGTLPQLPGYTELGYLQKGGVDCWACGHGGVGAPLCEPLPCSPSRGKSGCLSWLPGAVLGAPSLGGPQSNCPINSR